MAKTLKHKWTFTSRFRRQAFGWRGSWTAVQRVKEAVAEIKAVARKDSLLGAEGAVLFFEKVSPALEHVDSSSGAIGTAVNNAVDALVPFIAKAPADVDLRKKWLDRLWRAIEEDDIPYIEILACHWGSLCHLPDLATQWADDLMTPGADNLVGGKKSRWWVFQGDFSLPQCSSGSGAIPGDPGTAGPCAI